MSRPWVSVVFLLNFMLCVLPARAVAQVDAELQEYHFTQLQMAMPLHLTVWAKTQDQAETACRRGFDRAAKLVKVFSDYDPNSELSKLLKSDVGEPIKVSKPLMTVLVFCKLLHSQSNSVFDPTAGPVIQLWRKARKESKLPTETAIKRVLEQSGFDKLKINQRESTVALVAENLRLDFGGVAKGFIGDQVIAELKSCGIDRACFEAGGDFVMSAAPPGTNGWSINLGNNDDPRIVRLQNCAISTSGDTNQFVEIDGTRYSHVVDPRTGIGVTTGRLAIVIAPTGMQSDAIATVGHIVSESELSQIVGSFPDVRAWSFDPRSRQRRRQWPHCIQRDLGHDNSMRIPEQQNLDN